MLKCDSPDVIASLLVDALSRGQAAVSDLVVLALGAGTGMVGEALARKGVRSVVGIDIIPEAAEATQRDRPGTYSRYYVEDLCNLSPRSRQELQAMEINGLVCVSALGLHHVPAAVFAQAYNLVAENGWVAFNVNENTMADRNPESFTMLVQRMIEEGNLEIKITHPYRHRIAVDGSPINYIAMIARKHGDVQITW
jgi:SAM-dependent methyltransferase